MSTLTLRRVAAAMLMTLVLARGIAFAQYRVDAWTTEQGLPQATVIAVTQTPDGFLWGGTLGGLVRFDGNRFRVYDTTTNPEMTTSRLGAPVVSDDGQLFVLSEDRSLLHYDHGRLRVMGAADGLPEATILNATSSPGQPLYIETTKGTWRWRNGRFEPDDRRVPPASLALRFIGNTASGAKWYIDREGRGQRYDGDRLTRTMTLPAERADRVYEDRSGRLWMRALRTGELLVVTGDTVRRYGARDGLPSISTMWVLEDPDGTLWFAESGGLVRFRDGRFRTFTTADGLPHNYVVSVFRDREGNHWASTQGGLARLTEQPITTYSVSEGLAAKNVYPILQDRHGDIWLGSWHGLTRYRNGVFEDVSAVARVANSDVLSLAETADGAILIGLYARGFVRLTLSGPDRRITAAVFPDGPNIVSAIHPSHGGDVWFGGEAGAFRWHDGVYEPALPDTVGVSAFHEDSDGTLWIGHTAGLSRYKDGVLTRFGAAEGFRGRRVRMIYRDADGTLWLGTYDTGLFRYRNGTFTQYMIQQGLPANGAFQILEDARRRFWISSNSGIYRVAKSELDDVANGRRSSVNAVKYDREDGLANQECNGLGRPAGVRAADGRFWFPTQAGVAVFNPSLMADLPAPPVAMDVFVNGRPATAVDRVDVKFWSGAFEAHYAALTFVRPDLVKFKYKMEGVDTDWFDPGTTRMARYVGLPYGDFRFRVIAANRDGVWNEQGAAIAVSVSPPFWQTVWFRWLMIAAVIAAAFTTHRVRLGVLERQRAVQEAFARQLIDTQESDRRRIAAELHDGVSQTLVVIKNWARLGTAGREPQRLEQIAGAAEQALGEVRGVVHELLPYHLERLGFATAVQEVVARVSDASGVAITCDIVPVDDCLSPANGLRLFRVLQEGLNNVLKHSGATAVAITGTRVGDTIVMRLADNGRGFDPAAVKPTNAGHGFGLIGMTERVRMMGGSIAIQSVPGSGTTITIELRCDAKPSGVSA